MRRDDGVSGFGGVVNSFALFFFFFFPPFFCRRSGESVVLSRETLLKKKDANLHHLRRGYICRRTYAQYNNITRYLTRIIPRLKWEEGDDPPNPVVEYQSSAKRRS